jgi:hypothetical protein
MVLFPDQDLLVVAVVVQLQTKVGRVELDTEVAVAVLTLIRELETPQVAVARKVLFGLNGKVKI